MNPHAAFEAGRNAFKYDGCALMLQHHGVTRAEVRRWHRRAHPWRLRTRRADPARWKLDVWALAGRPVAGWDGIAWGQ